MWFAELPPFILFYLGALALMVLNDKFRPLILLLIPVLSLLQLWGTPEGIHWQVQLFNFQLQLFKVDKLSMLFGLIFHIATFIACLYAWHIRDKMQQIASLLYAGSAIGAVFAGDLISVIIFWEMLALTSVFLVFANRSPQAVHSAWRYFYFQLCSGLLLMAGVIIYYLHTGSTNFELIGLDTSTNSSWANWLIFFAFGIKAAFPLMHNWLTDAYAESTATGTVFLSAFTTKTAVYMFARGFPGTELLVYIGAAMTCFPIFYAVIENNLRRVLAYSMINQIGFMLVGIGIGTSLAINGAVAHAFNDILFKGLLFMSMGAVLHMTGRHNASELGGLYKSMPKTTLVCIIGAASISAFPLFSGFVSKSMVMTAALNQGYDWVWLMLLFASAGVFHHAGIKIPYFAFFAHDSGIRTTEPPRNMLWAMYIAAALCVVIGVFPELLYQLLPYQTDYTAYDSTHVLAQLQILFFSALAFVWLNLKGIYPPELPSVNLDVEWTYRKFIPQQLSLACHWYKYKALSVKRIANHKLTGLKRKFAGQGELLDKLATTSLTGTMVIWVTVLLASYLLISFI